MILVFLVELNGLLEAEREAIYCVQNPCLFHQVFIYNFDFLVKVKNIFLDFH
jgi:hypothetical protein